MISKYQQLTEIVDKDLDEIDELEKLMDQEESEKKEMSFIQIGTKSIDLIACKEMIGLMLVVETLFNRLWTFCLLTTLYAK